MRPSQLLAGVLALSSVSVAMQDAFDNIHGLADVKNVLFGRQDDQNKDQSSQQPTKTQASQSNQPSQTQNNDNNKDNKSSDAPKASGSGGSKTTGKPKSTSFDPRLPAGGLTMVTPNAIAGEPFYKIGDWVTFAWNYTSLSVTPSFVDVLASCTANQATYTIAVNHSATETTVLWDTKNTPSGQAPFLTEQYTLLIYDSQSSVSAAPRAGYLGVFNQLTFGMYQPRAKVDWADWQCANCIKNGGLSQAELMTLKVMLFASGTTVASLVYFAHNFGLW